MNRDPASGSLEERKHFSQVYFQTKDLRRKNSGLKGWTQPSGDDHERQQVELLVRL
jgi:hypothetical protein